MVRSLRPFLIVGDDHPTPTGSDQFVTVEAKTRYVAKLANRSTFVSSAKTLRCIFNHCQVVLACKFTNWIEINRVTQNVHWKYSFYSPSSMAIVKTTLTPMALVLQKRFHLFGIHLPVLRFGINKDRPGADIPDRISRGNECECRRENFVIRFNSGHKQSNMQRRSSTVCCYCEFNAHCVSQCAFKTIDKRTHCRNPTCVQTFLDLLPLVATDLRCAKRNKVKGIFLAAVVGYLAKRRGHLYTY